MQRVAILHLGQPTDDKQSRILRAEKLDLAIQSTNICRSSSVGCLSASSGGMSWAFTLAIAFFPLLAERRVTRALERRRKVDSGLRRSLVGVTGQAIGFDKRRHTITKELLGVRLERRESPHPRMSELSR